MPHVLHMTGMSRWRDSRGDIVPDSLKTEGFAHASPDVPTLLAVANAFYRDAAEQQVALVIDTGRLDAEVRWEAASPAPPPGAVPGWSSRTSTARSGVRPSPVCATSAGACGRVHGGGAAERHR